MSKRNLLSAVAAIALLSVGVASLSFARGGQDPAKQDPPKQDAPKQDTPKTNDPLTVTIAADKAEPMLGEEVQVEVKIENTGDKDLDLPEVLIEDRSLSFDMSIEIGGGKTPRPFTYSVKRPDPHVFDRLQLNRFTLAKGKATVTYYRLPTIRVGEMKVMANYKGLGKSVLSNEVKFAVKPSSSGGRLAAILDTGKGLMTIDLLPEEAPANVINFVMLARSGFYKGMIFHRVVKEGWVQTGCPYGLGIGGPGYAIASEAKGQETKHTQGTVSMGGFEKFNYHGSQFFITLSNLPYLDGNYTVIGKVSDEASLKVLKDIGKADRNPNDDRPKVDIELKNVTIVVK